MSNMLLKTAIALLVVFVTAAAVGAQAKSCPRKNGLTQAEINEVLKVHNAIRADHKVPELSWDCKLADVAQEWADRGVFQHRTKPTFGESLYVSASVNVKVKSAVQQWLTEKTYWDSKTSSCAAGKICTHYTQLVWKKTDRLGCGVNRNAAGKWKVLVVCNYEPAGNRGGPPF